ncbi:MAG: 23S rRNA (adenine(1618)-N(6))-methyltransferase, partial [Bacteroidetes bacterium]
MHKNNKHQSKYNFNKLIEAEPDLKTFVFENDFGTQTIDFANPGAVKLLNKALLKTYYSIDYWEFPDINLCPPIPGRV